MPDARHTNAQKIFINKQITKANTVITADNKTVAKSVKSAYEILNKEAFSLYILDLTLPDGSGYDVCREIKKRGDLPVIFLTAYDDEVNVVMGLELGADDYISKPFRVKELLARIKSVLRRYSKDSPDGVVSVGSIKVNTNEAKVYKNGAEIILTAMEYKLLLIFINNRGKVLSRQRLLVDIWDVAGDFVNDNTLTVYIKRLRDKIEEDPAKPAVIKTVRGLGYILDDEK
jgi:DNA-binding response OmpR family regulator